MLTSTNFGRKEKKRKEKKRKDKIRKNSAESLPRLKTCSFPAPVQIVITIATCSVACLLHVIS